MLINDLFGILFDISVIRNIDFESFSWKKNTQAIGTEYNWMYVVKFNNLNTDVRT